MTQSSYPKARKLAQEEWEEVIDFDLGCILDNCAYTSKEEILRAIEQYWKLFGEVILFSVWSEGFGSQWWLQGSPTTARKK